MLKHTSDSPAYSLSSSDDSKSYNTSLTKHRIVFLDGPISSKVASSIISDLLVFEQKDSKKDIYFYIMSPGGDLQSTLALVDIMNYVKPDIRTVCLGKACSGGAVLLANGTKGKRFILPNAKVMIHQPAISKGVYARYTELNIMAKEILDYKRRLQEILINLTGQTPAKIKADLERDHWLDAPAAIDYGLVDSILKSNPAK